MEQRPSVGAVFFGNARRRIHDVFLSSCFCAFRFCLRPSGRDSFGVRNSTIPRSRAQRTGKMGTSHRIHRPYRRAHRHCAVRCNHRCVLGKRSDVNGPAPLTRLSLWGICKSRFFYTLKYLACGWWTITAEVESSGTISIFSVRVTPRVCGSSSSKTVLWASKSGQAG